MRLTEDEINAIIRKAREAFDIYALAIGWFALDPYDNEVGPLDPRVCALCTRGAFCWALHQLGHLDCQPNGENELQVSAAFAGKLGIKHRRESGMLWWYKVELTPGRS